MSDNFEHDFEDATDEAAVAATAVEEPIAGEMVVEEPTAPVEDDFFAESAVEEIPQVDPNTVVTLIPSSAESKYVTIERPTSIIELLSMASLRFEGEFTCFLGQSELKLNDLVPGGSTVTIAGKVKGG